MLRNKVLRALWDKKYYLKPYYASEPIHSPVLRMLHLKDYLPDMGYRRGDGSGAQPEAQRLMASGNEAYNSHGAASPRHGLPESQRLSHPQSGMEHPFAAQMAPTPQARGRTKLAAVQRLQMKAAREAPERRQAGEAANRGPSSADAMMEREANGRHEAELLEPTHARAGAAPDSERRRATRVQVLAGGDEPPTSPAGVARWWHRRKDVNKPDAGDIWESRAMRRQRAQEHVAAKARLLDLCFGTLKQQPARALVPRPVLHASGERAAHESKKDEACRILHAAGGGDWLDASEQ
jgi:hypothetical protein